MIAERALVAVEMVLAYPVLPEGITTMRQVADGVGIPPRSRRRDDPLYLRAHASDRGRHHRGRSPNVCPAPGTEEIRAQRRDRSTCGPIWVRSAPVFIGILHGSGATLGERYRFTVLRVVER